jgi:hypothetical protein
VHEPWRDLVGIGPFRAEPPADPTRPAGDPHDAVARIRLLLERPDRLEAPVPSQRLDGEKLPQ